jgi:hypothetical protein
VNDRFEARQAYRPLDIRSNPNVDLIVLEMQQAEAVAGLRVIGAPAVTGEACGQFFRPKTGPSAVEALDSYDNETPPDPRVLAPPEARVDGCAWQREDRLKNIFFG